MKPSVRVFSKDAPCTKLEIWVCFRGRHGFMLVPVVVAQSQIGANVPRVMEREGRLIRKTVQAVDYYQLTELGEEWLYNGMRSYLKNHPAKVRETPYLPNEWGLSAPSRRLRRTR